MKTCDINEIIAAAGIQLPTPDIELINRHKEQAAAFDMQVKKIDNDSNNILHNETQSLHNDIDNLRNELDSLSRSHDMECNYVEREIAKYNADISNIESRLKDNAAKLRKTNRSINNFIIWRVIQWIVVICIIPFALYLAFAILFGWVVITFATSSNRR